MSTQPYFEAVARQMPQAALSSWVCKLTMQVPMTSWLSSSSLSPRTRIR